MESEEESEVEDTIMYDEENFDISTNCSMNSPIQDERSFFNEENPMEFLQ